MKNRLIAAMMVVATVAGFVFLWFYPFYQEPLRPLQFPTSDNTDRELIKQITGEELKSDTRAQALTDRANQLLARVKQICDDFHLQFVGPNEISPKQGTFSEATATLDSPDAFLAFALPAHQLEAWDNYAFRGHVYSGTKPQWSQDQAVQIGTAFLHALLNGADVHLDQGNAQFLPNDIQFHANTWVFTWTRLDSQGHKFFASRFEIDVPEGYGPVCVHFSEITPYVEKTGPMMSSRRAYVIACRVKTASPFHDWNMAGLVESSPVVYGNHLMWEFSIFTSSGEVAESATIFIDAYTGEYFLYTTL